MAKAKLTISSKNYSSWSLRGWLLCRMAGIPFDEMAVSLDEAEITKLCQVVQRVVVAERPFVTYDAAGNFLEAAGKKWAGVPKAADLPDYVPVPYGNPDTTLLFKNLVPSGNT